MTGPEAEKAGVEAAEALEPEVGLLGSLDPLAFGQSFLQLANGLVQNPLGTAAATLRLGSGLSQAAAATAALALGAEAGPAIAPDPKDRRKNAVSLTPRGARLLERCEKAARAANDELLAELSPAEREQFTGMLRRISGTAAG